MRYPLVFAALLLPAGCGLSREAAIPFHATDYAIHGQVLRSGEPLAHQTVKLYDDVESALIDSVTTDEAGQYGFETAPQGGLMVKVTSVRTGDFRYVRYIYRRASDAARDSVPPLDVFAYGCRITSPEDGAHVILPSPSAPLDFGWTPMSIAGNLRYRVRLADPADTVVWESTRDIGTDASFNGLGTNAGYAGLFVPPGTFVWRVKVRLPFNVSAATEERRITFDSVEGAPLP